MRIPTRSEIDAECARRFLTQWIQRGFPNYIVATLHQRLIAALEAVERGEIKRLMVFMPPRMGKTEAVSVNFPAWYLGRNPDSEVLMASYAASLSHDNSRRARNLFTTQGEKVFRLRTASDSSAADEWRIEGHRGRLAAVGIEGGATGKGADLLIIDDPVKDQQEALSETIRQRNKDWYRSVARTRLHPGARVVVVQTRWHEDDLAGWLLEEERHGGEKWTVVSLPMIEEDGSLLWPERYTQTDVDAIKIAVGTEVWESLYQQRPVSATGGTFKAEWWKRYDKLPSAFHEWGASLDCTFKGESNAKAKRDVDYVVLQVWGRTKAMKYLVWQCRKRLSFTQTIDLVKWVKRRWPQIGPFLIEDKANGPAVLDTLRPVIPGLIAVEPHGSKVARAHAVTPFVESGQVWLPTKACALDPAWISEEAGDPVDQFIYEHRAFPKGKHDDQVDATSQMLSRWREDSAGGTLMPLPSRQRSDAFDL